MATVDATTESGKAAAPHPAPAGGGGGGGWCSVAELALRALLFAVTLAALVVLATAKQTVLFPVPQLRIAVPMASKFQDSPALIYLLVALCVTCLYSLLTALASLRLISASASTAKTLFLLLLLDVFYAAVMASATGSAGGVAWIGLKGNTHTRWSKICDTYGKFCRHIGSSVILALIASIILVILAVLNAHSLYRRSR
ncbi:CASP-like protein 1D1 [Dichanthelium oligosanthes]|uniref:CASP-like protein n=1 Tax=Dichanthelium oligosanthes TaxID=888268 RepID=A0A1E5WJX5_9POAL|nr:CASP-like protein 1D1 [Dichanthelium oligosanthes]